MVETSKITGDFHLCKTRKELINDTYLSMGIVQKNHVWKLKLKLETEAATKKVTEKLRSLSSSLLFHCGTEKEKAVDPKI